MNDATTNIREAKPVKALILSVGLLIVGAVLSTVLGPYLEHAVNSTVSLIVYLAGFFANFVSWIIVSWIIVSWIIVISIMDGALKAEASFSWGLRRHGCEAVQRF
jgi:Zn-dependent protease with chaperone function